MSLKNVSGISLKLLNLLLLQQAWTTKDLKMEPVRNKRGKLISALSCLIGEDPEINEA